VKRLLRIIFGPKREEVTRGWRKIHNEELNDLYSLFSTIRLIKSRRMKWAVYVECMGRAEVHKGFWRGNLMERDHLEDPGIDGRIILRWIFRKRNFGHGLNRSGRG
jgi:hypothetical protein